MEKNADFKNVVGLRGFIVKSGNAGITFPVFPGNLLTEYIMIH
jgi:hypothetical protein